VLKDFKAFILRGNVVDLAVGVVIGAAFGAIVTSLVSGVFTPLISHLHIPDFSRAYWDLGPASPHGPGAGDIEYGKFLNAIISFLVIAAVVFFFVVKPLNRLMGRTEEKPPPAMRECPHCLTSIRLEATACPACTRDVVTKRKRGS
jgi:large conductance mechanosensitive channel